MTFTRLPTPEGYAMPAHRPYYPPLPTYYRDVRFQLVYFQADPARLRAYLPDPPEPADDGLCVAFGIDVPFSSSYGPFHEAGIQILVGTDAGGTIGHGRLADECAELVAAGIPDAAVVAAASWQGREYLGYTSLVEGASADFVVYPQDPRQDVGVLRAPTAIVLRGEIVAPHAG